MYLGLGVLRVVRVLLMVGGGLGLKMLKASVLRFTA